MLNKRAKFLLVATSLSPVLGAVAMSQFDLYESWKRWEWWLVVVGALLLPILCWALLMYAKKQAPKQLFYIKEFERKDQEVLVFLFIYLLPFIRSVNPTFASEWLTGAYVLFIIIIAIAYTDAFSLQSGHEAVVLAIVSMLLRTVTAYQISLSAREICDGPERKCKQCDWHGMFTCT